MEGTSPQQQQQQQHQRPGILFVGCSSVGKRTLIQRLLSFSAPAPQDSNFDDGDASSSSPASLLLGWSIDNKYYTADVSVWMAHLPKDEPFSISSLPFSRLIAALVLVFDASDPSSLSALQDWASQTDIHCFDILLCVANKVDLLPAHPAHTHYRTRLHGDTDPSADGYGISESQLTSLLGDEQEDPSLHIRRSCFQWCTDHNIEFIEACAANPDFDSCLSVDGDSQGIERIQCALSAHMWPGMILKSGNKTAESSLPEKLGSSEEESDYEFEYEVLSAGSAEPLDDTFGGWTSADINSAASHVGGSANEDNPTAKRECINVEEFGLQESAAVTGQPSDTGIRGDIEQPDKVSDDQYEVSPFDFEDLEQLMSEIGNMRNNLRFMPDFQRREMAANLAIKMAAMFGGGSDNEEDDSLEG